MFQPIGRIEPVVPVPSLLTSARPLPGGFQAGVAWRDGTQPSFNFSLCPASPRNLAGSPTAPHTPQFSIYTPIECDITGDTDKDDLATQASRLTEAHTPAGVAAALWMGTGLDPNDALIPTLRRAGQDVSLAGPAVGVQLDDGVAQLLAHYERATGGSGGAVIHAPSGLSPYALGGGAGGARLCWPEGNVYRGPMGSLFVLGPGYPNGRTPPGPNGSGPWMGGLNYQGNEVNTAWIYVTGPVEYAVGPIVVEPPDDADRHAPMVWNEYALWGRREAIVRFDPATCFATEVINPAPMPEVS